MCFLGQCIANENNSLITKYKALLCYSTSAISCHWIKLLKVTMCMAGVTKRRNGKSGNRK